MVFFGFLVILYLDMKSSRYFAREFQQFAVKVKEC